MSAQNHDRQDEEQRLAMVTKLIEDKTNRLKQSSGGIKDEIIHIRKTFWMMLPSIWIMLRMLSKHWRVSNSSPNYFLKEKDHKIK